MGKYRKKPVIIEAVQFLDDSDELIGLMTFMDQDLKIDYSDKNNPILFIETLEGTMCAKLGDYIIKGIKGELYPCRMDIFEETYDLVGY